VLVTAMLPAFAGLVLLAGRRALARDVAHSGAGSDARSDTGSGER